MTTEPEEFTVEMAFDWEIVPEPGQSDRLLENELMHMNNGKFGENGSGDTVVPFSSTPVFQGRTSCLNGRQCYDFRVLPRSSQTVWQEKKGKNHG